MNIQTFALLQNFLNKHNNLNYSTTSNFNPHITSNDIEFIFEMCRKCSYVSQNSEYNKKALNTTIRLDDGEIINAYAQTFSGVEGVGAKRGSHGITMMKGLINSSMLVSLALAQFKIDNDVEKLTITCNWIGNESIANGGVFTTTMLWDGVERFNYATNGIIGIEANSYLTGSLLSVIGHELGHICLSHTIRGNISNDVSRNDERQADLFAYSVTSTTPFTNYTILGTLFTEIIFAWMAKNRNGPATTHPLARERVYNTIASHESVLSELGITVDNIEAFLPPKNANDVDNLLT